MPKRHIWGGVDSTPIPSPCKCPQNPVKRAQDTFVKMMENPAVPLTHQPPVSAPSLSRGPCHEPAVGWGWWQQAPPPGCYLIIKESLEAPECFLTYVCKLWTVLGRKRPSELVPQDGEGGQRQ